MIKETEDIGYEPARSFKFRLVHALFGYEPARFSIGSLIHKAKKRFFVAIFVMAGYSGGKVRNEATRHFVTF